MKVKRKEGIERDIQCRTDISPKPSDEKEGMKMERDEPEQMKRNKMNWKT